MYYPYLNPLFVEGFFLVNHGSKQHQRLISELVIKLQQEGYHAINTNGIAPDGIATKDGKLYAIEVLIMQNIPKKGWEHLSVVREKYERYKSFNFDDVIFKVVNKEHKILTEEEKEQLYLERNAKKIVQDFINNNDVKVVKK